MQNFWWYAESSWEPTTLKTKKVMGRKHETDGWKLIVARQWTRICCGLKRRWPTDTEPEDADKRCQATREEYQKLTAFTQWRHQRLSNYGTSLISPKQEGVQVKSGAPRKHVSIYSTSAATLIARSSSGTVHKSWGNYEILTHHIVGTPASYSEGSWLKSRPWDRPTIYTGFPWVSSVLKLGHPHPLIRR